jgi:hypothetical protein
MLFVRSGGTARHGWPAPMADSHVVSKVQVFGVAVAAGFAAAAQIRDAITKEAEERAPRGHASDHDGRAGF